MAILFSVLTMKSGEVESRFLVGGIPRIKNDLKGWTAYENFIRKANGEIDVQVDSYAYGGGNACKGNGRRSGIFNKKVRKPSGFFGKELRFIRTVTIHNKE